MQVKDLAILDDIAQVIGFNATLRMLAIFGGSRIYIPETIPAHHVIARTIGPDLARALAERFAREQLEIPAAETFVLLQRIRRVAGLLRAGIDPRDIAGIIGISSRQLCRYRAEAEEMGLLDMVFKHENPADAGHGRINLRKCYLATTK